MLIIMLIISGANHRTFKQLKRVADYYADNQRLLITRCFIVNHLQSLPADYYADNQRPKPANFQTVETSR